MSGKTSDRKVAVAAGAATGIGRAISKAIDGPVSDDVRSYPVKVDCEDVLIEYQNLAGPDSR